MTTEPDCPTLTERTNQLAKVVAHLGIDIEEFRRAIAALNIRTVLQPDARRPPRGNARLVPTETGVHGHASLAATTRLRPDRPMTCYRVARRGISHAQRRPIGVTNILPNHPRRLAIVTAGRACPG